MSQLQERRIKPPGEYFNCDLFRDRSRSSFHHGADLRSAGNRVLQDRIVFYQIQHSLGHVFINVRSSANFHGIANQQLQPGIGELEASLWPGRFDLDVDAAFDIGVLAFDFLAIF